METERYVFGSQERSSAVVDTDLGSTTAQDERSDAEYQIEKLCGNDKYV